VKAELLVRQRRKVNAHVQRCREAFATSARAQRSNRNEPEPGKRPAPAAFITRDSTKLNCFRVCGRSSLSQATCSVCEYEAPLQKARRQWCRENGVWRYQPVRGAGSPHPRRTHSAVQHDRGQPVRAVNHAVPQRRIPSRTGENGALVM